MVKTGIPGFDSTLSVGLKKNSSVVVSGPPGSGKTTFGLQFVYSGAKEFDEPGVYISLSQSIEEIKKDCKSFGWDIEKLIENGKILIVDLRPFKIKNEVIERDDSLYRGEQIPYEHLTKFICASQIPRNFCLRALDPRAKCPPKLGEFCYKNVRSNRFTRFERCRWGWRKK